MNDIFISYSSKDRDWVKTLALALEAEGYDVWWDPEILPGQDYEKVIEEVISQTHCVLTIWSKNSIQSHWIKEETKRGFERNVYVPLLYQQVEVPMPYGCIQSANLIDWQGKTTDPRYQKLLRAIALKVKSPQKSETKPENKESSDKSLHIANSKLKQRYALWLIIVAVLMGGGYFAYNTYEKQIEPVANQLNTEAYYNLGNNYYFGQEGVTQDYKKAAEYYQKAADQGHAKAQHNLGTLYDKGKGVKQDYKKAAELYQKAADQGDVVAQFNLGVYYSNGKGVKQDYKKAVELYQKAADQGNAGAQNNLGLLYQNGKFVKQDYKKAAEYYQKAADQGDASGLNHLGFLYYEGKGVKQDYKKAAELSQKAAVQGNAYGQSNFGFLYEQGKGVKQDYKKAAELYQKAADQGHAGGQNNLGFLYEKGKGVKQDYKKVAELYQKAVDQGHGTALYRLERLKKAGKVQ